MATRELTGKVVDTSGEPQAGTDVWLSAAGVATAKVKTGTDGGFTLTLGDEFGAGTYRLRALATKTALGRHVDVELPETGPPAPVEIAVPPRERLSTLWGSLFLLAMLGILAGAIWCYLVLHDGTRQGTEGQEATSVQTAENTEKISDDLSRVLDNALEQVNAAVEKAAAAEKAPEEASAAEKAEGEAKAAEQALAKSMAVDSLKAAEEIFADLKARRLGSLQAEKVMAIETGFAQAKLAADKHDLDGLTTSLDYLKETVVEAKEPFFWTERPWIFLEALFWALVASLIRLIWDSGYYLYKQKFIPHAIPHHLALLVCVPILAVLISFFLSLVRVSIALSEVELVLDMDNVYVVMLIAALIGFAPWKAWNFLKRLADVLFERLKQFLRPEEETS